MKALTIHQPYAELIMRGDKLIENRNWPTRHRGTLLIHAGKSMKWFDHSYCIAEESCEFGAIVGSVQMIDCCRLEHVAMKHPALAHHKHANGPWCWIFAAGAGVRFTTPIVMNGYQGLWDYEGKIQGAL